MMVGTPAYVSPEQAAARRTSTGAAISTASRAYYIEMLSGERPSPERLLRQCSPSDSPRR
jgi:hypothetical protein